MKKLILGITASPRVAGNSEILTKAAMQAAGPDNKLEMIRLADLTINDCKACYSCLPTDVPCHLNDDLNYLLDKIRAADAVIFSAPCYFLGPQGSIKMLQDRLLSVSTKLEAFTGKPCVTITTFGVTGSEGYSAQALNLTARFLNLNLVDSAIFSGANPAEVLENPENLARARKLGQSLMDPEFRRSAKPYECPVCWNDLLRYDGTTVTCPFCGTTGEITVENQSPKLVFHPKDNHRFSEEGRHQHFEVFLNQKKQEFLDKRKYYKELQAPYRVLDWWVKPGEDN